MIHIQEEYKNIVLIAGFAFVLLFIIGIITHTHTRVKIETFNTMGMNVPILSSKKLIKNSIRMGTIKFATDLHIIQKKLTVFSENIIKLNAMLSLPIFSEKLTALSNNEDKIAKIADIIHKTYLGMNEGLTEIMTDGMNDVDELFTNKVKIGKKFEEILQEILDVDEVSEDIPSEEQPQQPQQPQRKQLPKPKKQQPFNTNNNPVSSRTLEFWNF